MNSDTLDPYRIQIDDRLALDLPEDQGVLEVYRLLLMNIPHLEPWMEWTQHISYSGQVKVIELWKEKPITSGFERVLYLDEEPIGACGLRVLDSDCGEMGYWLSEEYTGRGIMTRVAKFLTDYGFITYQLHRMEIHCAGTNLKSRAIPERLGYTHEATLRERHRLPSGHTDLAIYGLLRKEWEKQRGEDTTGGTVD